ncbi:MAG: DEAD/DEAH box helicase [Vicinamibacterales bacterium]
MTPTERLHPLVQHHIANSLGWRSLRPFQEAAIEPLARGAHALLIAPTAGGKTEAAMFPVFSRMLEEDWRGLGVLYVCPLRALLNNLLPRLEHYGGLFGRRVDIWHGDTPATARRRIVADPPDVLLTTPESLEVMLVTRPEHHHRLFGQVRVVVVDEIHAFAGDDRGWHLLAVTARLARLSARPVQRIGLSATVGNPDALLDWLVGDAVGERCVLKPPETGPTDADLIIDAVGTLANAATVIARLHQGAKRLVFCDSRSRVEDLAAQLRQLGVDTFVSHSSLSLDERRRAEEAFASGQNCVIVATSTLELGIDVGDLDHVIQIDAPVAVASFLQRLGRTGRRAGNRRNYLFLTTTPESLMQASALVRLWGLGHVEHVTPPPGPFHILAQQMMALALQHGGMARSDWKGEVGGVPGFQAMAEEDVEALLAHMFGTGILRDDNGLVWLGRAGEEEYGRRHFMEIFSAFITEPLIAVRHGDRHIGTVHPTTFGRWPEAEVVIVLGGRSWRVTHVEWDSREAFVTPSKEQGRSRWAGTGQPIRYELCQAMRDVLIGCDLPAMLSRRAVQALEDLRKDFAWLEADSTAIVRTSAGVHWWTFGGLYANTALATWFKGQGVSATPNNLSIRFPGEPPNSTLEALLHALREVPQETLLPEGSDQAIQGLKFNACLPPALATMVLQLRMSDPKALGAVVGQRLRFVVAKA